LSLQLLDAQHGGGGNVGAELLVHLAAPVDGVEVRDLRPDFGEGRVIFFGADLAGVELEGKLFLLHGQVGGTLDGLCVAHCFM
jgi:hypothetical protein